MIHGTQGRLDGGRSKARYFASHYCSTWLLFVRLARRWRICYSIVVSDPHTRLQNTCIIHLSSLPLPSPHHLLTVTKYTNHRLARLRHCTAHAFTAHHITALSHHCTRNNYTLIIFNSYTNSQTHVDVTFLLPSFHHSSPSHREQSNATQTNHQPSRRAPCSEREEREEGEEGEEEAHQAPTQTQTETQTRTQPQM
jgi:hypothetical protein